MKREDVLRGFNQVHPAGEALVELSHSELSRVHGGADVQPETTPVCAVGITASSAMCGAAVGGVVVGITILLTIKSC